MSSEINPNTMMSREPSSPVSPSRSTQSAGSTPSKVLAAKLESLDQAWNTHKVQSPIKIPNRRRGDHAVPRSIENIKSRERSNGNRQKNGIRFRVETSDSDSVTGDSCSVSTLGSTESVFDRLYRQAMTSPSRQKVRSGGKSMSNNRGATSGTLDSPVGTRHRARSIRSNKDRLGAYGAKNSPLIGMRRGVSSGEKTPRRGNFSGRIRNNHNIIQNGDRGDASVDISIVSTESKLRPSSNSSVFDRLYRNEKRASKLWKKPKAFSPVLSPTSKRKGTKKIATDKQDRKTLFSERAQSTMTKTKVDCDKKENLGESFTDPQEPRKPTRKKAFGAVENADIEPINHERLGTEAYNEVVLPTFADTSVSSVNGDESSRDLRTSNDRKYALDEGISATCSVPTLVEQEVSVGKQLDEIKANQVAYHGSASEKVVIGYRAMSVNASSPGIESQKIVLMDTPVNVAGGHLNARKEQRSSNSTVTSTSSATENSGFFSLDHSTRSLLMDPIAQYDELTSERNAVSSRQLLGMVSRNRRDTKRCRMYAALQIQSAWRAHQAEVQVAARMIKSWDFGVRFQDGRTTPTIPFSYRQVALKEALSNVKCWWILEGLHFQDTWITIAWENEVRIGRSVPFLVNLTCEAQSIRLASSRWEPTKLAILLVKATLRKTLSGEVAARKIARWYQKSKIQLHETNFSRYRAAREREQYQSQESECWESMERGIGYSTDNYDDSLDHSDQDTFETAHLFREHVTDSNDASTLGQYDDALQHIPSLEDESCSSARYSLEENIAAIKIQSFLRLSILKLAVREWPSMMGQLRSALRNAESSMNQASEKGFCAFFDEFEAARKILSNSMIVQYLSATGVTVKDIEERMKMELGIDFVSQRAAAIAIHNIVRAYLVGLKRYRDKKRAITIQAVFRGYSTRKRLDLEDLSALVIQFAWTNRRYTRIRMMSATKIQQMFRRTICKRRYEMNRFCIVFIQAGWRRGIATRRFLSFRSSVLLVQRSWRSFKNRESFLNVISGIASIQRLFRIYHTKAIFRKEMFAATRIQSCWRTTISRRIRVCSVNSTICIQSEVRSLIQRRTFNRIRFAGIMIQYTWRRYMCVKRFERVKTAAILLQTFLRKQLSIQTAWKRLSSIIQIQSIYRARICRLELKYSVQSSKLLQSHWRRHQQQVSYKRVLKSIVALQTFSRGLQKKREFQRYRCAIIYVQRVFRGSQSRKRFSLLLEAAYQAMADNQWNKAMAIQKIWRGKTQRSRYTTFLYAVVVIQNKYRKSAARAVLSRRHHASHMIQSWLRKVIVRSKAEKREAASLEIQRIWRGSIASRHTSVLRLEKSIASARTIQAMWRATAKRDHYHQIRAATITIQGLTRRHFAISRKNALYRERLVDKSSILIQSQWRAAIAREEYVLARGSAIIIQSSIRRVLMIEHAKTLKTQRKTREQGAVQIQSLWRGQKGFEKYKTVRCSILIIQTYWRRRIALKGMNELMCKKLVEKSAIVIQSQWRGVLCRFFYYEAYFSAITIQAALRRKIALKKVNMIKNGERNTGSGTRKNQKEIESSVIIQSTWRGARAREEYMHCRGAAMIIQSMFRGARMKSRFEALLESTVFIQRLIREYLGRKHRYEIHIAAVNIQRVWKGNIATRRVKQLKFRRVTESSTRIQSQWRASKARGEFAAMVIQALTRGAQVRSQWRFVRMLSRKKDVFHGSAKKIQVAYILWRMNVALWEMRSLAVLLKRGIRGQLARSVIQYSLIHMNAIRHSIVVDSYDRLGIRQDDHQGVSAIVAWNRAVSDIIVSAAIVVQCFVRRFIARNHLRETLGVVFNKSLAYATPTRKGHQAAIRIQRAFVQRKSHRNYAATLIQKELRGFIQRRKHDIGRLEIEGESRGKALTQICVIQQHYEHSSDEVLRKQSSIKIQSLWRRRSGKANSLASKARRKMALRISAATKIQASFRRRHQMTKFLLDRMRLVKLQGLWRKVLTRRSFVRTRSSVCLIQRRYRHYRKQRLLFLSVIKAQSYMRRLIARRVAQERRTTSAQLALILSDQLCTESCITSALFVESHLGKHDGGTLGPCFRRLLTRVETTMYEANSTARIILPNFVNRKCKPIPLPSKVRKLELPAVLCHNPIDSGTPVRSNKTLEDLAILDVSGEEKANSLLQPLGILQPISEDVKPSASVVETTNIESKHRDNIGSADLAAQASQLMLEARASMKKKRNHLGAKRDESANDQTDWNAKRLDNFCADATAPIPSIRSRAEKPEWDWTSDW